MNDTEHTMNNTEHPVDRHWPKIARRVGAVSSVLALASVSVVAFAGTASASTTAPYIRYGSRGEGVNCVQATMNYYDDAGLVVDGIDGPATTAAVKHFQKVSGLSADGIVGPLTGDDIWDLDFSTSLRLMGCYPYLPTTY
jgi:peptidoglycan hydrolase-like protein with peptidoglycan-binding domain